MLTIVISARGTSTATVEDKHQKLFFDDKGTARYYTAEALADRRARETGVANQAASTHAQMTAHEKLDNLLVVVQVPLKHREVRRTKGVVYECEEAEVEVYMMGPSYGAPVARCMRSAPAARGAAEPPARGMDMAVLGLGSAAGPFAGTRGRTLERDARFPVRATFQYYRATDRDHLTVDEANDVAAQLQQSTKVMTAHGSLVTTPAAPRATAPDLAHPQPGDAPHAAWGAVRMATFV